MQQNLLLSPALGWLLYSSRTAYENFQSVHTAHFLTLPITHGLLCTALETDTGHLLFSGCCCTILAMYRFDLIQQTILFLLYYAFAVLRTISSSVLALPCDKNTLNYCSLYLCYLVVKHIFYYRTGASFFLHLQITYFVIICLSYLNI